MSGLACLFLVLHESVPALAESVTPSSPFTAMLLSGAKDASFVMYTCMLLASLHYDTKTSLIFSNHGNIQKLYVVMCSHAHIDIINSPPGKPFQ